MSTRIEYRAVYQMPATVVDSEKAQERGYVERTTEYGEDKKRIVQNNYYLSRSEESLAFIVRWEMREVYFGEWVTE